MVDSLFMFSDAQSVASVLDDAWTDATYYMDLTGGTQGKDAFGNSINIDIFDQKLFLNVRVTTTTAGNALKVALWTDADTTFAGSGTRMAELLIPSAAAAGECYSVGIPSNMTILRYLIVGYETNSATHMSAGALDCWIGTEPVTPNFLPH